jgi:hypothetical protein
MRDGDAAQAVGDQDHRRAVGGNRLGQRRNQSSRRGVSQSACSTRALLGRLFCQCFANDLLAILASPAQSGNESTRCAWGPLLLRVCS